MTRRVILNADDFGLSLGITQGIIKAVTEGVLTSASLIANGEAFDTAVAAARAHPRLSVGVHLTLVEGSPLSSSTDIPSLVTAEGTFVRTFSEFLARWFAGRIRLREVEREWSSQVERVLETGLTVDKLDSHMNVHVLPWNFPLSLRVARRYGIVGIRLPTGEASRSPSMLLQGLCLTVLARIRRGGIRRFGLYTPDNFRGSAVSGRLTEEKLLRILQRLRPGVTEIMVHPGENRYISERWPSSRRCHHESELAALLSSKVKAFISTSRIHLTTYRGASSTK